MYRNEHPALRHPAPAKARRQGFSLGDLRREWVGRQVELRPAGQGPQGWLLVQANGETGWLPVGVQTLGSLYRAVGGDVGRVRGGVALALRQPVALEVLAALEPALYAVVEQVARGIEQDGQLGSFFSSIGGALSGVLDKVRDVAKRAASAAGKALSSVGQAVGKAASAAGSAIKAAGKPILGGALIVGGVAAGMTGVGLPVAGALVGSGVGVLTKSGSNLGKFSEWGPRALIGGGIGLAAGMGAQWIMNGGLSQIGSTLFSKATGSTIGTVAPVSPEAAGTITGTSLWNQLPVTSILKTAGGFFFKGAGGMPMAMAPAPGMAPTDPGMLAPPVAAAAVEAPGIGMSPLVIGGIALAGVLVLGLRR